MFDRLGELAIVKRRTGGYDGRGQWRLRADETEQLQAECYGECIVEQGINFSGEVSLVGARGFGQYIYPQRGIERPGHKLLCTPVR